MTPTAEQTTSVITAVSQTMRSAKDHLCALDAALGDGDHGVSIEKSFRALEAQAGAIGGDPVATILAKTATVMMTTVGGAMAPLFGAAFEEAGRMAAAKQLVVGKISGEDVADMIEAARRGVIARGKAEIGQKTMLDALHAASVAAGNAVRAGSGAGATLAAAAAGAEAGAASTSAMLATKGRASRLGQRSIGHPDPGATSVALLLRALSTEVGRQAAP